MPAKRRSRKPQRGNRGTAGDRRSAASEASSYEAEVLPGLVRLAAAELEIVGATLTDSDEDSISFRHSGSPADLLRLRRTVAVHRVLQFDVPRPKALLGHEHFVRLVELVERLRRGPPPQVFSGFRFGAAGGDSPTFNRLAAALEEATGLKRSAEGELLLRFRRAAAGGWEVLGRLTPRPLSARSWRECNLPGGLNATVAAAALELLGSGRHDRFLNLMCGSGTLLVERGLSREWLRGVGIDIEPQALACARRNVEAAGLMERCELLQADATALPFAEGSFERLCVDLPWGDVVGGHAENARLYPAFLSESARVAADGARLLVITHELRLFEKVVAGQSAWRSVGEPLRVFHGGHRPAIYLLRRQG